MRTGLVLALAGAVAAGGLAATAISSPRPPPIYVVHFMDVEPGGESAYIEAERTWWKPVHAELIRRGHMKGWRLFKVRYPEGSAREYGFATVNVYGSYADADRDPFTVFGEVHPDLDPDEVLEKTLASRRMVDGELWHLLDELP